MEGQRATNSPPQQQQQQQSSSAPSPQTGSGMLEDVILETLLRDHVDRFSSAQRQGQGRSTPPPTEPERK